MAAFRIDEAEALVAELYRLGVRHLARLSSAPAAKPMPPGQLLARLAEYPQARVRAALLLLFLRRPEFSRFVPQVLGGLDGPAADTLRLYYQAAVYLQGELALSLRQHIPGWQALPDLFSAELNLPPAAMLGAEPHRVDEALHALGALHRQLSGWDYNWAGSYRQHIGLFMRQLKAPDGLINA